MHKFLATIAVSIFSIVSGCSEAVNYSPSGTAQITKDYDGTVIPWESDSSETIIFYKVRNNGGLVEVCGAILTEGTGVIRSLQRDILDSASLSVNGILVMNKLQYFAHLAPTKPSMIANCATSGVAWQAGFDNAEPVFKMRKRQFVY